ncbi:MAG: discoidin domain-containing protein [Rhodopirellula sp.]|nr:discoidin domain-containing protein [Rhodopirellula sp.]
MKPRRIDSHVVGVCSGLLLAVTPVYAIAAQWLSPVAVVEASGPAFPQGRVAGNAPDPEYAAEKVIDGDPKTFCCLLDDTVDDPAGNKATIPAGGAEPVSGHVVFDLGRPLLVTGARVTARDGGGSYVPRQVDFLYFTDDHPENHPLKDDLEGDDGIEAMLPGHTLPPLQNGAHEDVAWDGVVARYVALRVSSSYESGGMHYNFQIGEIQFCVLPRPEAMATGQRLPPLYTRRATLAETLIATRAQMAAWYGDGAPAAQMTKVWDQVRRDFPAAESPLLEYVAYEWFEPGGWLAHGFDTKLEEALVRRAIEESGAFAAGLIAGLEKLRSSAVPAADVRWLELCGRAAEVASAAKEWTSLRLAVEDLTLSFPDCYPGTALRQRLDALGKRIAAVGDDGDGVGTALADLKYEALVASNPLAPKKILFVKRHTYAPGWYYAEFMRATRFGGNLCVLSLDSGEVTELVPSLSGGIFDRCDLSFEGRRVVFGYKAAAGRGFRLFEVGIDGEGLRQLTFDPPDEEARIARYWHPRYKPAGIYRHHTDDFHPCYLPDGGICFASTRCEQGVLCDQGDTLSVNVLYRIDGDGSHMRRLSQGALSESTPSVMNDGRILYTRWEYVDKGVIAVQSLWAMRPDGSGSMEIYGNEIEFPPVFIHARAIPGTNDQFVCTATMHHPFAVGPILRVDARRDIRTHAPIDSLTPDTSLSIEGIGGFPHGENYTHLRNGRWMPDNRGPLFAEPYPLADPAGGAGAGKYFLVTCNPDRPWNDPAAYGLYLIDRFGNRVKLHSDPAISCWQPMPVAARPKPPLVAPIHSSEPDGAAPGEAVLVMSDVYRGLEGVKRGEVKYLRVLEQVPRPWSARRFWPDDEGLGQHAVISMNAHIFVKVHHGVVPVHGDGSACFIVPARRNLFFQALDANFMELQRMRSFVNLEPGESRSCIGCHEPRRLAPPPRFPQAMREAAARPASQPGEIIPRPIHYVTDVQPILDKHCVSCHRPEKQEGGLDLSGALTTWFNRSYEEIMSKKLVAYIQEFHGPLERAQKTNVVPLPPKALGSHASRLVEIIRQGHYDTSLSAEEMARLVTWADANAPYYGSYFGRRNLIYRGHSDFRPLPTLESACGEPP